MTLFRRVFLYSALAMLLLCSASPTFAEIPQTMHEDKEARSLFLRFASMYRDLDRHAEKATAKDEIDSQHPELQQNSLYEKQAQTLWNLRFEGPNLFRMEMHGDRLVCDGERLVTHRPGMGFYAEREVAPGRGMIPAVESVLGGGMTPPATLRFMLATTRDELSDAFPDCVFRGSGADTLGGEAAVWLDMVWTYEDGCGNVSTVSGFIWFAAETGRLMKYEIDLTDVMNKQILESIEQGHRTLDATIDAPPYDRYAMTVEIESEDRPGPFAANAFAIDLPKGLERVASLAVGDEEFGWGRNEEANQAAEQERLLRFLGEQAPTMTAVDTDGDEFDLADSDSVVVVLYGSEYEQKGMAEALDELDAVTARFAGEAFESIAVVMLPPDGVDPRMFGGMPGAEDVQEYAAGEDRRVRLLNRMDERNMYHGNSKYPDASKRTLLLVDADGVVQSAHQIDAEHGFPTDQLADEIATALRGEQVYDMAAYLDRKAAARAEIERQNQESPMIPDEDVNPRLLRVGDMRESWGHLEQMIDCNNDGAVDLLWRAMRGGYIFEDGITGERRVIKFEGTAEGMEYGYNAVSVLGVVGDRSLLLVQAHHSDQATGESRVTLGGYSLDGRVRWQWTRGRISRDAEVQSMPGPVVIGDLNGDGEDEIITLITHRKKDATYGSGNSGSARLTVLAADGELIASVGFDELVNSFNLVESPKPGMPGRLILTTWNGTRQVDVDF